MRLNTSSNFAQKGGLFNNGTLNLRNSSLGLNKNKGKSNVNKKSISAAGLNPLLTGKKVSTKKTKKTSKSSLAELIRKAEQEKKTDKSKTSKKSAKKLMADMVKKSNEKQKLQNLIKNSNIQETVGALSVGNHQKNIAKYVKA